MPLPAIFDRVPHTLVVYSRYKRKVLGPTTKVLHVNHELSQTTKHTFRWSQPLVKARGRSIKPGELLTVITSNLVEHNCDWEDDFDITQGDFSSHLLASGHFLFPRGRKTDVYRGTRLVGWLPCHWTVPLRNGTVLVPCSELEDTRTTPSVATIGETIKYSSFPLPFSFAREILPGILSLENPDCCVTYDGKTVPSTLPCDAVQGYEHGCKGPDVVVDVLVDNHVHMHLWNPSTGATVFLREEKEEDLNEEMMQIDSERTLLVSDESCRIMNRRTGELRQLEVEPCTSFSGSLVRGGDSVLALNDADGVGLLDLGTGKTARQPGATYSVVCDGLLIVAEPGWLVARGIHGDERWRIRIELGFVKKLICTTPSTQTKRLRDAADDLLDGLLVRDLRRIVADMI